MMGITDQEVADLTRDLEDRLHGKAARVARTRGIVWGAVLAVSAFAALAYSQNQQIQSRTKADTMYCNQVLSREDYTLEQHDHLLRTVRSPHTLRYCNEILKTNLETE